MIVSQNQGSSYPSRQIWTGHPVKPGMLHLAQVVRQFGDAYLKSRHGRVPVHQRKALVAIESCRTSRLGGIRRACSHCGHDHVRWHSCRNRHCPRCQKSRQQEWIAARPAQTGPGSILLYLARYVYRVAIDESRLLRIDTNNVTFSYKDYRDNSKLKTMTLRGEEFLRRFLGHILPTGFVKVRHYGIFAHALKATALKQLRTSLGQRIGELAYATEAILTLLARNTPRPPKPQCPRPAPLVEVLRAGYRLSYPPAI